MPRANERSLIILQGMDTSGKDGTIKHVFSGVNPQGCSVVSFKAPSAEELAHDYLCACMRMLRDEARSPSSIARITRVFLSNACIRSCPRASGRDATGILMSSSGCSVTKAP